MQTKRCTWIVYSAFLAVLSFGHLFSSSSAVTGKNVVQSILVVNEIFWELNVGARMLRLAFCLDLSCFVGLLISEPAPQYV